MANTIYTVGDELFCFWATDLRADAVAFVQSLDPDYFLYVAKQGLPHLGDSEDAMRAGASLRLAFFHGTETLMLLLGAVVQAPACPQAYVGQCQNAQLRSFLSAIDSGNSVRTHNLRMRDLSWRGIASEVLRHSGFDSEQVSRTVDLLAQFWAELSAKSQDSVAIEEYNSLKHGFRVGYGGYKLQFTLAPTDDLGLLPAEITLGDQRFGTSFNVIERLGGAERANRSRAAISHHVGWNIEGMLLSLELLRVSIQNVAAYLGFINGAPGKFLIPDYATSEFEVPRVASGSYSISPTVPGACATTKDQLATADAKSRAKRKANAERPGG